MATFSPASRSSQPQSTPRERSRSAAFGQTNWPLRIGYVVALFVLVVVCFGPSLAPHDPLKQNFAARIGDRWAGPPFPPFQSLAYPLGSDRFGRDLWSRLLWAVRPTMILVTIVALARLVLGAIFGLIAGWSQIGRASCRERV